MRAYTYIRSMGPDGLKAVTENAVLNANYMMRRLAPYYDLPYDRHCKHEFVLRADGRRNWVSVHLILRNGCLILAIIHQPFISHSMWRNDDD